MRKFFILLAFMLFSFTVEGQDYRKYWADGKLTWEDFQGQYTQRRMTNLAYMLTYQTNEKLIDNVLYQGLFSEAYINKALSFVHPNLQDANSLAYNQVIFNLLEISKRKLQKRLFNLETIFEAQTLLMDVQSELEKQILDFQEASFDGLQNKITNQWKARTEKELLDTRSFFKPDYKKSNWTYGLYAGLDYGMYGDTYKDIFNNTLALAMGFEFSYKNLFLSLNMSLTNSKLNRDIQHNAFLIPEGDKSTISLLNTSLGYPLYETNKFRILPFVGYGITAFGEVADEGDKDEITKGTTFFGLNFDFKNRKRVNFTPTIFNIREEGNTYIRARIFISNSNFNPTLKGYGIHIGIAYGLEARLLSKK